MGRRPLTQEEKARRKEVEYLKATGGSIGIGGKKVIRRPSITAIIETFDKWKTTSFCVTLKIHINHIKRKASTVGTVNDVVSAIRTNMYRWVCAQEEYDNNYICVVDAGNSYSSYEGKTKTISIELTLKQKQTTHFKDAVKTFESKTDSLCSSLTHLLVANGLELREFKGYRSKEYNDS